MSSIEYNGFFVLYFGFEEYTFNILNCPNIFKLLQVEDSIVGLLFGVVLSWDDDSSLETKCGVIHDK